MNSNTPTPEDLIAPACWPTVERLQSVLDGELEANAVDADAHPAVCAACRERVAVAKLMLSVLATPEPVAVPARLTDCIVDALIEDRYVQLRNRKIARAVGIAATIAASLLVVAWSLGTLKPELPKNSPFAQVQKESTGPAIAPEPRAVASKPLRIGDELSKVGPALWGTPKSITEPASAAPEMFAKLTDAITRPITPMPEEAEPARSTLAELPDAARTGLEPLTDTAQKAFTRLLRDVGTVSVKPKS